MPEVTLKARRRDFYQRLSSQDTFIVLLPQSRGNEFLKVVVNIIVIVNIIVENTGIIDITMVYIVVVTT